MGIITRGLVQVEALTKRNRGCHAKHLLLTENWIWGAGPALLLPTGSDDLLSGNNG